MKRLNNLPILKERRIELRKNQTAEETKLWSKLRLGSLGYKFKRQHSVGPYILDFYCPSEKLAVELDGSQHLENKEYDEERFFYLDSLGIKTIRFWNKEINTNLAGVIGKIKVKLNNLRPAKGEVSGGRKGYF